MDPNRPAPDATERSASRPLRAVAADPARDAERSRGHPEAAAPPQTPSPRARVQRAFAAAHHLGLFTGPTWTVLTASTFDPDTLRPFVVRARSPQLAAVTAAAVLRSQGLRVLGIIPGDHRPISPRRPHAAAELAASHPEAYAAARDVLDSHLAQLHTRATEAVGVHTGPAPTPKPRMTSSGPQARPALQRR
jgi:hypothetical protein